MLPQHKLKNINDDSIVIVTEYGDQYATDDKRNYYFQDSDNPLRWYGNITQKNGSWDMCEFVEIP